MFNIVLAPIDNPLGSTLPEPTAGTTSAGLLISILTIIAMWKIFKKAGHAGFLSLIPVVNTWIYFEIAGFPGLVSLFGWLGLVMLAMSGMNIFLAYLGFGFIFVFLIALILFNFKLSKRFGHGFFFGLGLCLFNTIFLLILGFGSSRYRSY